MLWTLASSILSVIYYLSFSILSNGNVTGALATSQDGYQERSSDNGVDKEKVLLSSVHKGTNAVIKKKQVVPQGKLGRGFLRVLSWGKAMSMHV